jgi:hypothetical protein
MSLVLLLSLGLFTATSASASDDALNVNALLEPKVSLFRGVLPPNVCKELIAIGERCCWREYPMETASILMEYRWVDLDS